MANVAMPQQKAKGEGLGKLLTIGGAVAGGVATGGSPQGAMMGASAGQMAGGLMAKPPAPAPQAVETTATGAMQRRMQALQAQQANVSALRDADAALASLPPQQAQQYAPAIKRARTFAEQEYA